jgi:hypothetical protein
MTCAKCKTETPEGLKFCIECGGALKAGCAACGFENLPTAKFCGECGAPLVAASRPLVNESSQVPVRITDALGADTLEGERKTVTGFWAAAREVWPETREQGCWCHKLGNVLDKLPQRLQPRAKRTLHEMMYAECRADCEAARARFEAEYQPKYPQAVESLTAKWERLVTFFDFPAEHWKHLRTTNVIESPFATVRLRERATRGAGSRTKGTADGVQAARDGAASLAAPRWRPVTAAGSCRGKVRRGSSGRSCEARYSVN